MRLPTSFDVTPVVYYENFFTQKIQNIECTRCNQKNAHVVGLSPLHLLVVHN